MRADEVDGAGCFRLVCRDEDLFEDQLCSEEQRGERTRRFRRGEEGGEEGKEGGDEEGGESNEV